MSRTPIAWTAVVLGLAAAVAAVVFGLGLISTVGDVEAIESSLSPRLEQPGTAPEDPSQSTTTLFEPPGQDPIWSINSTSVLGDLSPDSHQPVSIRIDAIGASAVINPYGINERTGQMDVPGSVNEVAWYRYGPSPGEPGSAVLAAHVDLKSQGPGVFFKLRQLEPGDEVVVAFDDGSEQTFVVEARTVYQKENLPTTSIFSRQGPSVLTLITCGGGFSEADESYDSNVVVYAVPIEMSLGSIAP